MRRSVILLSAVCLLAACTQKELNKVDFAPSTIVFTAETESSRAFVNGTKVCWAADDSISVFGRGFNNAKFVYTGEDGASHGTFASGIGGPGGIGTEGTVYAAYPYDSYNEIDNGVLYFWVPEYQEFTPDSFDPFAGIMVAASADDNLPFKNVCGFLNVRLYGDCENPVLAVSVKGNNGELITGDVYVTASVDGEPVAAMGTDAQYTFTDATVYDYAGIALDPSESKAVDIWFAIPPTDFSGGITLAVLDTDYNEFTITSSNPLSIKRGVVTSTAPVEVVFPDDPIEKNYDMYSYDSASELDSAADWYGDWNYYAIDLFGSTGVREYQGKVTISASATPTEGPDSQGGYDEYVYVDGLFPNAPVQGPANSVDTGSCILEMDVYSGLMYSFAKTTLDEKCNVYLYTESDSKWYAASYYSAFIPVGQGIFAFVDVSGAQYNFESIGVYTGSYFWDAFSGLLLIDPAVDTHQVSTSSVKAAVARAKANFARSVREVSHVPYANQKEFAKAAVDNYKNKQFDKSNMNLKDKIVRRRR
jgi:hypothetical protein